MYAGFPLLSYFDRDTFVFTKPRSTIVGGVLSALGFSVSIQALLGSGGKKAVERKESFELVASIDIRGIHRALE